MCPSVEATRRYKQTNCVLQSMVNYGEQAYNTTHEVCLAVAWAVFAVPILLRRLQIYNQDQQRRLKNGFRIYQIRLEI